MAFIPFKRAESGNAPTATKGWAQRGTKAWDLKERFYVCCEDDDNKQYYLSDLLKTNEDMLYICGHCDSGSDIMQSDDYKHKVDVKGVLSLLIGGDKTNPLLKFGFCGVVKVYGCDSATSGAFWQDSFTQRLANAMYKAGYKKCSFYGYEDNVSMKAGTGNDGIHHRWVMEKDKEKKGQYKATDYRASTVRKQIFPKT